MNNIRVGIVGTGFMAVVHLRAYEAVNGIEIGALCNPSGRNLDGDFRTCTATSAATIR